MPFTPSIDTICEHCGKHFLASRPASTRQPARFCSQRCGHDYSSTPIAEKLWGKVVKTETCWEWTGYRQPSGHGQLNHRGRVMGVHRVAYELQVGPVPEGMSVCHHCDNPPCVRPEHLFLGTHKANMADATSKGRLGHAGSVRGERHHNARLTEDAVLAIRDRRGQSHRALAREFGVSRPTIARVLRGESWQHV